ncbi:hypothetical protein C7Y66_27875 [Chroococcidiopsis sp. CCALA 051]|uniref:hypothetical protein n=1 Tax=Chroococcidiopsis sp. CCALA 051 TaxID=869949 RepID=UPI000D0CDEFF|nr:hypothetical protein [Chroococcidiopsis sp. CCALA 051]MBE9016027.1 hypothetical protein [Chroococcidiopsidales cyanobacterium LEGE 13417]PSM45897.1 hypothetical protein C7Y66_27875 [Chroococcidiopsis sp. CCALA 051]
MNSIFSRQLSLSLALLAPIATGIAVFGSGLSAQAQTMTRGSSQSVPTPGTTSTKAKALSTDIAQYQYPETTPTPAPTENDPSPDVDLDPGQATRGGSSYLGVAGNIGLGGDSAIGETSFAVISKIGLANVLSARPSVAIEDDPVILLPLTYDFSFRSVDPLDETLSIAPYLGGGVAIEASDDADVGFLLTGGVDVPLSDRFTATAAVNAAFLDDTDVGLLIGVGYNFAGF